MSYLSNVYFYHSRRKIFRHISMGVRFYCFTLHVYVIFSGVFSFRNIHQLCTKDEQNSAVSYNPFSRLVPNAKPPAWSFKPYLCKLCKNGFSTKNNSVKHIISQHGIPPGSAASYVIENKLLQDKSGCFPPGITETVKRIQDTAQRQMIGSSNRVWNGKKSSDHDIPLALTGPYGKIKNETFITSPPISHPLVKNEPLDSDDQPIDFSMQKTTIKSESQQNKFSTRSEESEQNLEPAESGEEPMDLTVKSSNKKTGDTKIQRGKDHGFFSSRNGTGYLPCSLSPSSANRGVVSVSSGLNVCDTVSFPPLTPPPVIACSVNSSRSDGDGSSKPKLLSPPSSSSSNPFALDVVNLATSPYSHFPFYQGVMLAARPQQPYPAHVMIPPPPPPADLQALSAKPSAKSRQKQQWKFPPAAIGEQQADSAGYFRYFNHVVGKFQCPLCNMFFKNGGQVRS